MKALILDTVRAGAVAMGGGSPLGRDELFWPRPKLLPPPPSRKCLKPPLEKGKTQRNLGSKA